MESLEKSRRVVGDHTKMIGLLGGPTAVAELLFSSAAKRPMVGMWSSRGVIPPIWRPLVAQHLATIGWAVPDGFLDPRAVERRPSPVLTEDDDVFAPTPSR